jgi:hypothetical protein
MASICFGELCNLIGQFESWIVPSAAVTKHYKIFNALQKKPSAKHITRLPWKWATTNIPGMNFTTLRIYRCNLSFQNELIDEASEVFNEY